MMIRSDFDASECVFVLVDAFRHRDALRDAPRETISERLRRASWSYVDVSRRRVSDYNDVVAAVYRLLVATTSIGASKSTD